MRRLKYLSPVPITMNPNEQSHKQNVYANFMTVRHNRRAVRSRNFNQQRELTFPAYANLANKNKIRNLSQKCCAYCGMRISSSTTVVEHFRPKNSLSFKYDDLKPHRSGNKKHSDKNYGYFKLGDNYTNLLPSCACCNSGQGDFGVYITKKDNNGMQDSGAIDHHVMYGKDNFFPVFKNRQVDYREGELYVKSTSNEIPLLFNPYLDCPDDLFDYRLPFFTSSESDDSGIKVIPKRNINKVDKLKAIASINLLGLNRSELCHARFQKYRILVKLELELDRLIEGSRLIIEEWSILVADYKKEFNSSTASYIGFATALFSDFGNELHQELLHFFPDSGMQYTTDFKRILNDFDQFCSDNPYEDYLIQKINRVQQGRARRQQTRR